MDRGWRMAGLLSLGLTLAACGSTTGGGTGGGGGGTGGTGGGGGGTTPPPTLSSLSGQAYGLENTGAATLHRAAWSLGAQAVRLTGGTENATLATGTVTADGRVSLTLPTTLSTGLSAVDGVIGTIDLGNGDVSCDGTVTSSAPGAQVALTSLSLPDSSPLYAAASANALETALSPDSARTTTLLYADQTTTVRGTRTCTFTSNSSDVVLSIDWNIALKRGWNAVDNVVQLDTTTSHVALTLRAGTVPTTFGALVTPGGSGGTDGTAVTVTNKLANPVQITLNGTPKGTVAAHASATVQVGAVHSLDLSFEVQKSSTQDTNRQIGDDMAGYFDTVTNPGDRITYTIDNVIGDQVYFQPIIVNDTSNGALMGVNYGLQAENLCQCVVTPGDPDGLIGYYRAYSNSNVVAFPRGSGYTGPYVYWEDIPVPRGDGVVALRLTRGGPFTAQPPATDHLLSALGERDAGEHAGRSLRPADLLRAWR